MCLGRISTSPFGSEAVPLSQRASMGPTENFLRAEISGSRRAALLVRFWRRTSKPLRRTCEHLRHYLVLGEERRRDAACNAAPIARTEHDGMGLSPIQHAEAAWQGNLSSLRRNMRTSLSCTPLGVSSQ